MSNKNEQTYWQQANQIGWFLALLFVVCFIWYYLRPVEQDLHLRLLKLSYFGFNGMNIGSFVLGVIQSYIWAYIGWVFGGWLVAAEAKKIKFVWC